MLYFSETNILTCMHHIHSFLTHFPFICYNDSSFLPVHISRANGFIMLPPLTFASFKAVDVTLKQARFLKIRNMALYQERTILIVSKFQYTQCICSRPVKLKPIILLSEISRPDYVHVNTCNNVQIMHPNANIDETRYFV